VKVGAKGGEASVDKIGGNGMGWTEDSGRILVEKYVERGTGAVQEGRERSIGLAKNGTEWAG